MENRLLAFLMLITISAVISIIALLITKFLFKQSWTVAITMAPRLLE